MLHEILFPHNLHRYDKDCDISLIKGEFVLGQRYTWGIASRKFGRPFLANVVPFFHPSWLSIIYRLGKVPEKYWRFQKSTALFYHASSERASFLQSSAIAKAGQPGKRIFISKDLSKISKKKWAKKGDGDLQHMPKGPTLCDSCTFVNGNSWAFQSNHSLLSKLYQCVIKRNGFQYASAEHASQHDKLSKSMTIYEFDLFLHNLPPMKR